ncbi:4-(cytidine 5'-diphospho)-2-C-methyl-D-erythritol kinase [candidate division KSB1 bacterium]|nr:4-(cytidine 5'-diphospho)-2-C-methyl-D-erythritol kinase [candidate division KSB1 bacterium]
MEFKSFAKINIGLRIIGKRSDGFHNIETLFQQIDVHDVLDIEPTRDGQIQLKTNRGDCPADSSNLAYRAAERLKSLVGDASLGCRMSLSKNIPIGAGLGGGSSNAAVTLTALNRLWRCALSGQELSACAAGLGSDVPFFLRSGLALGTGKGDILTAVPEKLDFFGLLVYPHVHISTAWVYSQFNLSLTKKKKMVKLIDFIAKISEQHLWKKELENDLTEVVFARYPEFRDIPEKLYQAGAFYAQMSGSGSAFFGLFAAHSQAERAEQFFRSRYQTIHFKPIN